MDEPGGLRELGETGRAAWDDAVARCMRVVAPRRASLPPAGRRPAHAAGHGSRLDGAAARVVGCLRRARALELLDEERRLQEEYLEWRTVRDRGGAITRVELTTELRDYWRVLAAHEPARTVDLVGELSGRAVEPREVYGIRSRRRSIPRRARRRSPPRCSPVRTR